MFFRQNVLHLGDYSVNMIFIALENQKKNHLIHFIAVLIMVVWKEPNPQYLQGMPAQLINGNNMRV